jgi:hypothetical protein
MQLGRQGGLMRSMRSLWAGCLVALVLAGCGGSREPSGNDVEVTGVGPVGTVVSGTTATFRMTVTNIGNNAAQDVRIVDTPGNYLAVTAVRCSASGGAVCPDPIDVVVTLSSLPVGGALIFEVDATVNPLVDGTVTNTMTATVNEDVNRINNSATATASAAVAPPDPSGTYKVFAADGREYEMTIDFASGTYTMSGNGASGTSSFTAGPDGTYVVAGDQRFRVASDLIVGGHAFTGTVVPYVAARSFSTSISVLGALNLMTRNVNADGSLPVTRAGTARASGNILQICEDDFEVVQAQACSVGALKSYLLSVSGDVFSGVETTNGEMISFRVARSGAAALLIAAGPSTRGDATLEWRIGLAESAGLAGGTVFGPTVYPDSSSDWVQIDLTRTTYAALGAGINDVAGLTRENAQAPVAMLLGYPEPDLGGAPIWVMQAYPLVVVIGATTSPVGVPNVSGMLQVGVP